MKQATYSDFASFNPCYSAGDYLEQDYVATAVQFLDRLDIPSEDRVWGVCREFFLPKESIRKLAIIMAKEAVVDQAILEKIEEFEAEEKDVEWLAKTKYDLAHMDLNRLKDALVMFSQTMEVACVYFFMLIKENEPMKEYYYLDVIKDELEENGL